MSQFRQHRSHLYDDLVRSVVGPFARACMVVALSLGSATLFVACIAPVRGAGSAPAVALLRLAFVTDTLRTTRIAPGLTYRYVHSPVGPWAIHLLEVDRSACWSVRAIKAHGSAIGREPTSALLRDLAEREPVVAGVNADFFSFTSPGVPAGAHLEDGRVVTGPGARPVIAFDSAGAPFIGMLGLLGSAITHGVAYPLGGWNRVAPRGLALLDRSWGTASDSGSGRIEVSLGGTPLQVLAIDTLATGVDIPRNGGLLVAGRDADIETRRAMQSLHLGDTVAIDLQLTKAHLRDVVGGWPVILRDSAITGAVDSAGATFAPVRHPRTAIGIAREGRELLFVVVDGRQMPYSDGMTLRELAELLRSLGARDALNLDGGGSSTFVLADSLDPLMLRVRNHPSDNVERPVANALAVVHGCGSQS